MKKFKKAAAAIMLILLVVFATRCKPEDEPNNVGNGGNNDGSNPIEQPAGMYLGIIGFNDELHIKPLTRLDASSISASKSFIEGLTMGGATLLYHAVNSSVDEFSLYGIPKDLVNVSIVTFTDGLDKGSYAYSNTYASTNFSSGTEYLNSVTQRIRNEKIDSVAIEAHTIGIQGTDVYSYDLDEFLNNLQGLSSLPKEEYVHNVSNFEDIQSVFDTIASKLHNSTTNSMLTIKMPVEDPNTRVRFTLDVTTTGPNDALNSSNYLEGVYVTGSNGNGVLSGVRYVGINSSSGSTVVSDTEGVFAKFKFEGMKDSNDKPFDNNSITHIKQWLFNSNANAWIHNSEFTSGGNTEITNEYYSSMIMLNLDCSQSLGVDKFIVLKDYAKKFVNGLKVE